jgi:hypothetical protein
VGPCHYGMVPHRVADGGYGLQTWWVAASILNKQSLTDNKGWSSSLLVGRGVNISSQKKNSLLRNITQKLETGWILWNNLGNGKRI